MRVLIADDDATSRTMLASILTKWGYDVAAVDDGVAALRELQRPNLPQVALLNWSMPGMEGPDICRALRHTADTSPRYILLLTAKDDTNDIVKGLESGANDYITKPFDSDTLQARVRVGERMVNTMLQLYETQEALAHQALHDPLTGISNRAATLDALKRELFRAQREKRLMGVGLLDIDHFKEVNDVHGHLAGDEALCGFARILERCVREYDLLGRYGGEEFLVVAVCKDHCCVELFFNRLRQTVGASAIATRAGDLSLTVSIGVALADGMTDLDAVLSCADKALYLSKRQGRNRITCLPCEE